MKKILITGARSGIINRVIDNIISKDYYIYLTVENEKQLEFVNKKYEGIQNIECFKLDVTDKKDKEKIASLDVDILINNAAIGEGGSIAEIPMEKVRNSYETNVFSPFEIMQIVMKKMMLKKEGKIIIISSLSSIFPLNFLGVYSSTKASISILTETLHNELKILDTNIKVKLIEPGMYHTGFNQVMLENKYDWMSIDSYFKAHIENIRKKENFIVDLLEQKKLNSIVKKIEKAIITNNNHFRYSAPLPQFLLARLYSFIKK